MQDGKAWGLFLANTYHVEFDLAHEDVDCSWFGAAGGDLIYYVFCGPSIRSVLDRYTELTGRTPMAPLWALGYHQSRYSYMDADELRSVAHEFRRRRIPCDVLYLDIHYMDGYRVFTWDRERFPDPPQLIAELQEQGFHVVTIIDPGVKVDDRYQVYLEGREQDFFCKTADGGEYHNVVWPGLCAFPDFTSSATRAWWGSRHQALLDDGVAAHGRDQVAQERPLGLRRIHAARRDRFHRGWLIIGPHFEAGAIGEVSGACQLPLTNLHHNAYWCARSSPVTV